MCVCYHAWRVSVLESKIQLLTRWTAAQDDGKDVLRRNYVAYRHSYKSVHLFKCKKKKLT